MRPKKPKSFLRKSVPKLFLILTASLPAVGIPSIVIARSKELTIKCAEGECVQSHLNEPLSKSGRFPVGEEHPSHFARLVSEGPVMSLPPNTEVVMPQEVTYEEAKAQEKEWEKTVPEAKEMPKNIQTVPQPPKPLDETELKPFCSSDKISQAQPNSVLKLFPLNPENYGEAKPQEEQEKGAGQQTPTVSVPQGTPTVSAPQQTPTVAAPQETPTVSTPQETPTVSTPQQTPTVSAPQQTHAAPAAHTLQRTTAPGAGLQGAIPEEIQTVQPPPQAATPPTQAQLPEKAAPPPGTENGPPVMGPMGEQGYLANYTALDIKEFMRFISQITDKNFIYNENDLNFTISMISEKPSTPDELLATLMQQLRIHGLAVIEDGSNFIIHTNPEVNAPGIVLPRSPGEEVPSDVQVVTQVFRLNVIPPSEAVNLIKPLLSAQAVIQPLDDAGILTLTDLMANIEKVKNLLIQLDFPSSGLDVSHYQSQFISADTLATLGARILTPLAEGKEIQFIPLRDTNTIFIISTPIMVRRAIEFFSALDKEIKYSGGNINPLTGQPYAPGLLNEQVQNELKQNPLEETLQAAGQAPVPGAVPGLPTNLEFDFYKLEFRKGDEIQQALSQIASSLAQMNPQGAQNDLYNAISSVQWIETSNTLVFTGTPSANAKIIELIQDLDVPNQQVLIEMLLLDTSIDQSYSFGVDWGTRFGGPNAAGSQAFLSPSSPLPVGLDNNLTPDFLNAQTLARSTGFSLGVIGRTISCNGLYFSELGALISAVDILDIGKVILNPKIVVEENTTAEIFVGLNIPYKTQSIANDFGTILTSNFEYRDIGARMTVTPIINKNGIITLEIEQELSTLVSSTTEVITSSVFELSSIATGAGPTTRKSNSKTTVFVPNGHFVILSGMIQDESERMRTQVPCLGGVPVLGGVFSQKNNLVQNRNLMIFIRPSLINTPDQMTYFTKREQDIYDQKNRHKDLWKYEIEEALDFLNISRDHCQGGGCCGR